MAERLTWTALAALFYGAVAAGAAPQARASASAVAFVSQGKAKAGKVCVLAGYHNASAAIGMPLDGLPDTRGVHGNEVDEIFVITELSKESAVPNTELGFLATTFNRETFYQFPVLVPGTTSPVVLNVGKLATRPNAEMSAAAWFDLVDRALALTRPRSSYTKAAHDAAVRFQARANRSGTVTITSCFDGPWDGRTTDAGT